MQRPSVKRDVLMLVASFILSPLRCSLQRSDPARSHTVSLRTEITPYFQKLQIHQNQSVTKTMNITVLSVHEFNNS